LLNSPLDVDYWSTVSGRCPLPVEGNVSAVINGARSVHVTP